MSEESKAIREEAAKTRLLIIRLCVVLAVIGVLFAGCQEAQRTQAKIDAGVEEIMDQVGP